MATTITGPRPAKGRFTLSAKVGATFALVCLLAVVNMLLVRGMVREQDGVAESVGVAGRLRMLSQKIAFETLYDARAPQAGWRARLLRSRRDYVASLDVLASGGQAFGYRVNPPSAAVAVRLGRLRAAWRDFDAAVERAIAARSTPADALRDVSLHAELLLADAENVVALMTGEARAARQRTLYQMYALLVADLVLLALAFGLARRQVVRPLRELARQSRALGAGDYTGRMAFASGDEIGELALCYNRMAHNIEELVGRLTAERRELREAESTFRGLAENSMVGVYIVEDAHFRFVNPKMAQMFGYDREEMMTGVGVFDLVPEDAHELVRMHMQRRLSGEVDEVNYERRARRRDGSLFDIAVFGSRMQLGERAATIGVVLDITERKRSEREARRADAASRAYARQLEYIANHDALTGLANRNLLAERMRSAIAAARRNGRLVAVLLHDLDNFKVINDSLGHGAGDLLLASVARRMVEAVRDSDTVARLGGDEFVIVMPDVACAEDALTVGEKVLHVMSQPFFIENQKVYVRTSIGISLYPRDGADEQTLLKNVDLAMYRSKQQGKGRLSFYTEEMNSANRARQRMEVELHNALERGEFLLHYQPKQDCATGRICGVEALLRWMHPRHGMVSPAEFIPLAEETGLITLIGAWVLREACRQNRSWQQAGLPSVGMAVNLSACQLQRDELLPMVRGVLHASGLAPRWLELEITETAIMRDAEDAVPLLEALKEIGVGLSLDDFGTGYSSLNYLRRFPLDSLKIDRTFVAELHQEEPQGNAGAIVTAMVAMARGLDLRVVAEGVETQAQADYLRAQGCDALQGYHIGRPLSAAALEALLRAQCEIA
jgi:diguanylate cyclase (GGDEF)-like protein/PAS domain S-box-containing protein